MTSKPPRTSPQSESTERSVPPAAAAASGRRGRVALIAGHSLTRFLAVSTVGYTFDVTVLLLLQGAGLMPRWANVSVSFCVTYALNFALNRWVAFDAAHRDVRGQLRRYLPQVLVDFLLTLGGVELLAGALGLPLVVARMLAGVTNLTFNYTAYRWWTFRAFPGRRRAPGAPPRS